MSGNLVVRNLCVLSTRLMAGTSISRRALCSIMRHFCCFDYLLTISPSTLFFLCAHQTQFAQKVSSSRSVNKTRSASVIVKAEREMWYPGATAPDYLDGSMAGDYGFDPLRLGANKESLPYLQEAELMNGRWAMYATIGVLATDSNPSLPKFWEAGAADYDIDFKTLVVTQVIVMGILEALRIRGFMKTGESGLGANFPFDPAGMDSPAARVKEVKNGRLAMVAFLGMVSQWAVTGMGPIEGFKAHLADPTAVNIYTSAVGGETVAFIAFLSCAPVWLIAQRQLTDGSEEEFKPIPW